MTKILAKIALPPLLFVVVVLCGGCVSYGLDPKLSAVESAAMPKRAEPIPTRLVADFVIDGKRKTGTRHEGYKRVKRQLEESGVFVVRDDAEPVVIVDGLLNLPPGAYPRAVLTGMTFMLVGFDERVDQSMKMRFERGGRDYEQRYVYEHHIGTGTRAPGVAKRDGDSFSSDGSASQAMIGRVVDQFIVELDRQGMLR